MDLITAQGAVTALRNKTTLDAAYHSYDAGHDDKHRKAGVAYGYNFAGATGDETAGYYQAVSLVPDPSGTITREISAWGKTTVATYSQALADMTRDQEKQLLLAAFSSAGGFYAHPNPSRFCYGTYIPAGFRGFVFQGGGKVYPKIATETRAMLIVVSTGRGNVQIVTHFPEFEDRIRRMAPLV